MSFTWHACDPDCPSFRSATAILDPDIGLLTGSKAFLVASQTRCWSKQETTAGAHASRVRLFRHYFYGPIFSLPICRYASVE